MNAFCSGCGSPLQSSDKFCSKCGKPSGSDVAESESMVSSAGRDQLPPAASQGIEVVVGYRKNPLLWLLVEDLRVSFDGGPEFRVREGKQVSVQLPPGRHRMKAYIPYFMPPKCGYVEKSFEVGGRPLRITFTAPWITFMEGSVEIRSL